MQKIILINIPVVTILIMKLKQLSKVKEEVDINANLISRHTTDNQLDGKFRISVIATGIESESYYQNLIDSNNSNEIPLLNFLVTK